MASSQPRHSSRTATPLQYFAQYITSSALQKSTCSITPLNAIMSDTRDLSDVVASATAAVTFAIVVYCHYGSINHRSTWDRQHLFLPMVFVFFPEIHICQVVMDSILVRQRRVSMRKHAAAMNDEGFWSYVGGILDLHSKDRAFAPGAVWIGDSRGGACAESRGHVETCNTESEQAQTEQQIQKRRLPQIGVRRTGNRDELVTLPGRERLIHLHEARFFNTQLHPEPRPSHRNLRHVRHRSGARHLGRPCPAVRMDGHQRILRGRETGHAGCRHL